jgi:hypothetical protein
MNARLTIITLLIYTSLALIIFVAMKNATPEKVFASVYPRELTLDDVLFYSDSTPYAKSYVWDFDSNNNKSYRAKGTYKYTVPGPHLIRLSINNKVVDSFRILVKEPVLKYVKDTVITIYAVPEAIVGQSVHFKALGSDAIDSYEWYFGETGKVNSRQAEDFYTYSSPGTYKVKLITNLRPEPVYHTIKITPAYTITQDDPLPPPASGGDAASGIKEYIQKIANGGSVSTNYNTIVSKFLCKNTPVTVLSNGGAGINFYAYCQNLRLSSGVTIDQVATEFAPGTNCINKLIIKQH